jgi:hypothetical protein
MRLAPLVKIPVDEEVVETDAAGRGRGLEADTCGILAVVVVAARGQDAPDVMDA